MTQQVETVDTSVGGGQRDLLSFLFSNRTRTLIAVAVIAFCMNTIYEGITGFVRGFRKGWGDGFATQSTPANDRP